MSFLGKCDTGWNMKFLLFGFGKLGERKCVCACMCVCACAYIAMGECKYINKQGKYNKKECLCFCYFTYELKRYIHTMEC